MSLIAIHNEIMHFIFYQDPCILMIQYNHVSVLVEISNVPSLKSLKIVKKSKKAANHKFWPKLCFIKRLSNLFHFWMMETNVT